MLKAWDFASTNSPENISQQNHSSFTENADQMLKRKYSVNINYSFGLLDANHFTIRIIFETSSYGISKEHSHKSVLED